MRSPLAPLMLAAPAAALVLATGGCAGPGSRGGSTAGGNAAAHGSAGGTPGPAGLMADQDGDSASVRGYYDGDDGEIRSYGQPADAGDAAVVATVVRRYYVAAAGLDAKTACALTYYLDAETMPEQYGEPPGPLWLKGARTCEAVLARVFAHFHAKLAAPPAVTAVRVRGSHADALVGFKMLGAGYVRLHREGDTWKVDGLLAAPLP